MKVQLCHICGKIAEKVCVLCGKPFCEKDSGGKGICSSCALGRH